MGFLSASLPGPYSPRYVSDSWEEYQKLARVYRLFGASKLLSWTDTPLPHGLSYDSRLQIYKWFLRHLNGVSEPIGKEPDVAPEPDSKLWVSKTGNLVRSIGGETPFSLTKQRAASLRKSEVPLPLDQLLGVERPRPQAIPLALKKVSSQGGITIEALDIRSVAAVNLPAWLFRPAQEDFGKPVLLILHPSGRNAAWKEGELCHQLALSGLTVCAADVRGVGDLLPEFSPGAPGYAREHESEEDYAWSSLILGRPLVGQRVTDILAITNGLRRSVAVAALGTIAVPALFVAALEPEIKSIYLAGGLSSYRNIVETEEPSHNFANFVPDVLAHVDLPELVSGLAPRRVVIAGAVDARDIRHSGSELQKIYAEAVSRGHVELRENISWDAKDLIAQING